MLSHFSRTHLLLGALAFSSLVLAALALPLVPQIWNWLPFDYTLYRLWGTELLQGLVTYSYPLPTIFWVSIPLALLPPQFVIIWAAAPFAFVLYLLRGRGIPMWLYFPLLVQSSFAQLDGWLIIPMSWLLDNRPRLAPLGAVLLLTKPTVAPVVILYMLWYWLTHKNWAQLKWFSGILAVFVAPSFIIDPLWVPKFLQLLFVRANESNMVPRGASLWAWVWHGGITLWLLPIVCVSILIAVIYLLRHNDNLAETANTLNMFVIPSLYLSTFTLLIPNVKTLRESIGLMAVSWLAVLLDILAGGWGGVYATIPMAALLLLVWRTRLTHPAPN